MELVRRWTLAVLSVIHQRKWICKFAINFIPLLNDMFYIYRAIQKYFLHTLGADSLFPKSREKVHMHTFANADQFRGLDVPQPQPFEFLSVEPPDQLIYTADIPDKACSINQYFRRPCRQSKRLILGERGSHETGH